MTANDKFLNTLNIALSNGELSPEFSELVKREGGYSRIAEEAGLNRESLYKALGGSRDPRLSTLVKLLGVLGLKLKIEIDREALEVELSDIGGFEGPWIDLFLATPQERMQMTEDALKTLKYFSETD